MACYTPRRRRWLDNRDSSATKMELLKDLKRKAWSASELQRRYGMNYTKWIRDLKLEGHPIWRMREGGRVLYYFERSES